MDTELTQVDIKTLRRIMKAHFKVLSLVVFVAVGVFRQPCQQVATAARRLEIHNLAYFLFHVTHSVLGGNIK